jgi:hypothetical protein
MREVICLFLFCKVMLSLLRDTTDITLRYLQYIFSLLSPEIGSVFYNLTDIFPDFYLCTHFFETFAPEGFFYIFSLIYPSSWELVIIMFAYMQYCYLPIITEQYCPSSMASSVFFSFESRRISDDSEWGHIFIVIRGILGVFQMVSPRYKTARIQFHQVLLMF